MEYRLSAPRDRRELRPCFFPAAGRKKLIVGSSERPWAECSCWDASGSIGYLRSHSFAKKVRELDLPRVGQKGVEQSWSLGEAIDNGILGSIRTDVYLKDVFGRPVAIYDLKTGNERLTRRRIQELRNAVGWEYSSYRIEVADLTALQRWQ
jgi:hypothetical protein